MWQPSRFPQEVGRTCRRSFGRTRYDFSVPHPRSRSTGPKRSRRPPRCSDTRFRRRLAIAHCVGCRAVCAPPVERDVDRHGDGQHLLPGAHRNVVCGSGGDHRQRRRRGWRSDRARGRRSRARGADAGRRDQLDQYRGIRRWRRRRPRARHPRHQPFGRTVRVCTRVIGRGNDDRPRRLRRERRAEQHVPQRGLDSDRRRLPLPDHPGAAVLDRGALGRNAPDRARMERHHWRHPRTGRSVDGEPERRNDQRDRPGIPSGLAAVTFGHGLRRLRQHRLPHADLGADQRPEGRGHRRDPSVDDRQRRHGWRRLSQR